MSINVTFKNSVTVKSTRLDASLVFSICQNSEEIGSNTSEAMDLRVRTSFLLPCPSYNLPIEDVVQARDGSSISKDLD